MAFRFDRVWAVAKGSPSRADMDDLITFMSAGGVPHDKIMQSLELFGTKVMPSHHGET